MNEVTFSNFKEYNDWQVVAPSPPDALTAGRGHQLGRAAADLVARQHGMCSEDMANTGPIRVAGAL